MQSIGPNRAFGLLLTGISAILSLASYWGHGTRYVLWAGLTLFFALISWWMPRVLAPLRGLWIRFGHLLGRFVNPLVLGLVYLGVIIPVGALMRLFGKDSLALRQGSAATYWIERHGGAPTIDSMKEQF